MFAYPGRAAKECRRRAGPSAGTEMQIDLSRYRVKLAETEAEREGAQRLRYRVFVEEMGAHATPEEAAVRREWDDFDPCFDHLILLSLDPAIADPLDRVVGVYRLMRGEVARAGPGFYGAGEYDLAPIAALRPAARRARPLLRRAASTAAGRRCTCSGTGSRATCWSAGSSSSSASRASTAPIPRRWPRRSPILHHEHLAPPDLRVRAQPAHYLDMNLMPREAIDAAAGAPGHPAADQGLPAPRRLRRRGRLRRPRLQHHRRLRGDGHRADDRALPALLPAHPGAARVRAGWNEAEPPALPPLTRGERLRLALRALWSVAGARRPLRASSCRSGASTSLAARLAGRPVSALGPAVVRLWAAQALPTLGLALRAARRADAAGAAPSSPTIRAGSTSWRCSARRRPSWSPRPRCGAGRCIGHIGRAIGTMFIDRRPAEAKRQEAELLARLARGDRMAIFPEGTSTDGQRVLPFKSSLFGVFFAPELAGRHRGAAGDASPTARAPACPPPSTAGGARWTSRATCATCMARSTGGVVEVTFHPPLDARRLPRPQGPRPGRRRRGAGRAGAGARPAQETPRARLTA